MADIAPKERLQPSLLDRLTDDEPDQKTEARDRRVLSMRRLRECVLRDLTWLLNADNLAQTMSLDEFPMVESSTVNFGLRDLAGVTLSKGLVAEYENEVRQAILNFEPRILPHALHVRAVMDDEAMDRNALSFEIEGELWADPVPMRVLLKTEVDIESGEVTVTEAAESRVA
ncbi:MAG: type VI secretion system lysozyme [Candidatus Eisenbacteria bacterium RBG_16_71_46]|nr:MAG: type VI secretion system lysozyme [Candidatus Eisenbacteria bacterium RBG_16_71_46]OGF23213.1 MAG: type VI secretion system lysozyme [Candidatus Eisenbacteria bacterium RBG_19FT_COMBO_70_11]